MALHSVRTDNCLKTMYIGETSRNLYTRAKEHMGGEHRKGTEEGDTSFVRQHMEQHHPGMESRFRARVTRTNKDSFSRQVREGVLIRRSDKKMMNSSQGGSNPRYTGYDVRS